jgi:hypothetical protein
MRHDKEERTREAFNYFYMLGGLRGGRNFNGERISRAAQLQQCERANWQSGTVEQ